MLSAKITRSRLDSREETSADIVLALISDINLVLRKSNKIQLHEKETLRKLRSQMVEFYNNGRVEAFGIGLAAIRARQILNARRFLG